MTQPSFKTKIFFNVAVIGFVLASMSNIAFGDVIRLDNEFLHSKMDDKSEYLEDVGGHLELSRIIGRSELPWRKSSKGGLNFGFTSSVYWVQFELENHSEASLRLLLEIAYPLLNSITVYQLRDKELIQQIEIGSEKHFNQRPVKHPNFLIPLAVDPRQRHVVLLRVASKSSMSIPIDIWRAEAFLEKDYIESTIFGIVSGGLLIIGLYQLMLFLSLGETSFFTIAMLIFSILIGSASVHGSMFHFIWPSKTSWTNNSILLSINGGVSCACFFTRTVLLTKTSRPRIDRMLKYLGFISLSLAFGTLFMPYAFAIKLSLSLIVVSSGCNGISHFIRMKDGYAPAKYVFLAGIFYTLGLLTVILEKAGVLESNYISLNGLYIGAILMCLFYAFALSYRMNMDRAMRIQAEQASVETQKRLLQSQIELNRELDQRVRERTLELENVNKQLREMNIRDGLTKLYNRSYFDEIFEREYKRAFREMKPISVLMLDIDHFKKINDTHGHLFGDLCLIETGKWIVENAKRPQDIAARYGGEEFVVLLPDTFLEGARKVAEHIHKKFNTSVVASHTATLTITASIGVACCIPAQRDDRQNLLNLADACMYRAKQEGRNRIESAEIKSDNTQTGTPRR